MDRSAGLLGRGAVGGAQGWHLAETGDPCGVHCPPRLWRLPVAGKKLAVTAARRVQQLATDHRERQEVDSQDWRLVRLRGVVAGLRRGRRVRAVGVRWESDGER